MDQHRLQVEHSELLTGIMASAVANYSMAAPRKRLVPADFMPCRNGRKEEEPAGGRVNRKKVASDVRDFFARQMRDNRRGN